MSDRDTILQKVAHAASRRRANHVIERLAARVTVWVGIAVAVKLVDLARPFGPAFIRGFWVVWLLGLVVAVLWSLRMPRDLPSTAAELDRRARLDDEVLSAWWFVSNGKDGTPWIDFQVHRAAARVGRIDIASLYPRVLPRLSFLAAAGVVLLAVLHLAPLSFSVDWVSSRSPARDPETDRETLMQEIEGLLARAEALEPDGSVGDFRDLMDELRSPDATLSDLTADLEDLQSRLDEGNLTTAGILEGLEDMANELMEGTDTASAGEALAQGDLEGAAADLDRLAGALAAGEPAGGDLAGTLERAAEDARAGLEDLAESMLESAGALESGDEQAAGESLAGAADALRDLSDLLASQDLRNQASDRIDALQQELETSEANANAGGESSGQSGEPGAESGSADGESGDPGASSSSEGSPQQGEPAANGEQASGDGTASGDASQPPGGDSTPGSEPQGDTQAAGQPGNLESAAGGDSGMIPAGLGFSPEQKTGAATSLEVQLQQEATEAQSTGEQEPSTSLPDEEATRQERSRLDYQGLPSDLTPAQQELLNQEQIPREYRNLIRDYFQAIRPPVEQ